MDQMNLAAAGPALGSNASYIEKLYARWKESPGAVAEAWQTYFTQLETGAVPDSGVIARAGAEARPSCIPENEVLAFAQRQVAVQQLVAAYRNLGAEISDLDPLKNQPARVIPELDPSYYGLTDADLDQVFSTANTYFGRASMTLRELIEALRETYCGKIGAEFMYITDPEEKRWWQQRLESIRSAPSFTPEAKVHILERLTASEGLEHFLHKRYTGQKRFSLEGGESFIVAMDRIVEDAASRGMKEIVIGMAHRGRLNVLVNIQNKDLQALYDEFDGKESAESLPSGDVKYHNGFENSVPTASGPIWVSMEFNPSHLEAADPVALGSVRAREDQLGDREGNQVLGILVHGDAAFSGQGIVQETLNLASTRGFGTGGTVHIVINNQIGFTTSDPRDKGSMLYCTDPAKVTETPVLHVNGDEPESVALATQIAMECRLRFHRDVVLDIVCYRRLGHNEQDTPAVTQPLMYKKIDVHPTVRELYGKALEENGIGRPSTYAPIITTIIDRGYVERDQKKLKPTLLGRAVDGLMLEQFPHIVDVDFSAQMEKNLDKVESGKADWRKTVDDFYQGFEASLEQAEKNMEGKKVKVPDEPSSEVCDLCGRPMVIKVGKYGKFLACSGFPECRGTKRLVKDTGGICPKCGKGRMLERKSAKGRIYYGCERYPDCDFMTWDMPVATKCEKCGSTLFRKGSKLYCAKEGCGFEMPVPKKD